MKDMETSKKVLNWIVAILKGTLVGLAIVIPGVSGGSMLLTIGVYEDAVSITSRDKAVRTRAIKKLIPYALGIVLGVAALSFVVTWLLANFELYTILLFCGLILGALPMLIKQIRGERIRVSYLLIALLMVLIMVGLPYLNNRTSETFEPLEASEQIRLNDRIVLVENGKSESITVQKGDASLSVLKVKSAKSGLAGLRASVSDGVMLEREADDTFYNVLPVVPDANGATLTVDGKTYTVYRAVDTLSNGVPSALLAAVLGFVAAGTMIVPGISGSMVLLVLGYYNSVMTHLKSAIVSVFTLDFAGLLPHLLVLVPFAIGVVLGLLIVSKVIKWLLDRHPVPTYYAIIGLMLSSPYAIFQKATVFDGNFLASVHWYTVLIGAVCLAAGFLIASRLSGDEKQ